MFGPLLDSLSMAVSGLGPASNFVCAVHLYKELSDTFAQSYDQVARTDPPSNVAAHNEKWVIH